MTLNITTWKNNNLDNWVSGDISKFGSFISGTGFPHEYQGIKNAEINFFKVGDTNLAGNEKYLIKSENTISQKSAKELGARLIPSGSIVFPKVGAALLGNKRRIMQKDAFSDNNTMAFIPYDQESEFWYYVLSIIDFGLLANPGPVPSINETQLRQVIYTAPPVSQRQKIAKYLNRGLNQINKFITEKQTFITLLEEKRQALISEVVTKGLDDSVPMKDSGVEWIGEIPADWSVGKAYQYIKFIKGVAVPAEKLSHDGKEKDRFLRTGDYWNPENRNKPPLYAENTDGLVFKKPEDLTICFDGFNRKVNSGSLGLATKKYTGYIDGHLFLAKCFNIKLHQGFLNYLLQADYVSNYAVSNAVGSIALSSTSKKGSLPVVVPDIESQQEIECYLDQTIPKVDLAIEEIRQSIELLKEQKDALITAAVTGQIDVREYA